MVRVGVGQSGPPALSRPSPAESAAVGIYRRIRAGRHGPNGQRCCFDGQTLLSARLSLLADPEIVNQGFVAAGVGLLEIVEQAATLSDQHQQAAPRMMVLLVCLEVVREVGNAL